MKFSRSVSVSPRPNQSMNTSSPRHSPKHPISHVIGMILMLLSFMAYSAGAVSFNLTMQQPSAEFGTLAPPGVTAYTGAPLNIAANPSAGYKLKQWTATPSDKATFGDPTNKVTTITLTGDVTVSAEFEKVFTLTMTFTPASPAGGSVTPITGPVTPNTPVAITATAAGGYIFKGWTASPSGNATIAEPNNPATTVSLSGNATVNANFVKGCFMTPAVGPTGWGTVTPGAVTTVEQNVPVQIKATPAGSGHVFANWTAITQFPTDKVTFANPNSAETTVTLTGNATIYANFSGSYTLPLENLTGLDPDRYTVYVLGYSVASQQMLTVAGKNKTGSFTKYTPPPPKTSAYIPSFKMGTEITSITVTNSTADPNVVPLNGARIYFFVADSKATYDDNSGANGGPQFKILSDGGIEQCGNPPQTKFPIFNYVELTFLAGNDMFIDVSSVDGFFFPVTITATDNAGIVNLGQLGQPLTDGMTGKNIVDTYKPFMDNLTAGGEDASAYLDLYTDPREASFKGLLNPGLYLQKKSSMGSSLHTAFDEALNKIFTDSTFVSNISLWQNWSVGNANYDDVFNAEIVTATFPGTTNTHPALKLKGKNDSYTIFNPVGFSVVNYKSLDGNYHSITGTIANNVLTFDTPMPSSTSLLQVGMYVSSGGGSTDGTTQITAINKNGDNIVSVNLNSSNPYSSSFQYMFSKAPTNYYYSSGCMVFSGNGLMADGADRSDTKGSYRADVIKGLENQIVTALNRGVGVLDSGTDPKHTTIYWATETNWYPKNQPQNFFSLFMHTAKYGDEHIFTLPSKPATSARGDIMAMSYGFSYDENPMGGVEGPQVPSEFRPPFPNGTTNLKITLGSWPAASGDATLTMGINNALGGTISPDVGDHAYQYVASVPVTATANAGYQFGRWNVSGSATVDKPGLATGANVNVTGATAGSIANFAKTEDISSIAGGGKISVTDLADLKGGMKNLLVINVTAEKNLKLTTSGGTGDCDIYVKQGMAPNLSDYYMKSTVEGTSELLNIANPQSGDWFILLYSASGYSGVNLDIAVDNATPDKPVLAGSIAGTKVNLEWTSNGTSHDVYRGESDLTSAAKIIMADTAVKTYQENFTGTYYYYWVKAKVIDPNDHGKYLESDFSNVAHPHGPDVITKILKNGVPETGISGTLASTKTYQIDVPAGQALLEIKAYGGKGEYDMDAVIDGSTKKYRALTDPTIEIIRIENPEAGSYLIHLYGKTAYNTLTLVAKYYGVPPLPVTRLTASKGAFSDRIILNWTDSPGATHYEVWRAETSSFKKADKIGNCPDNSYEDNSGLNPGILYYYWIKAANSKGISAESANASGNLLKKPSAVPTGLTAGNKLRFDKITLAWPNYVGATSYVLYRSKTNDPATATILAEIEDINNQTAYAYDDMGDSLALNTAYYYFMKAKNGSGTSGFSAGALGMLKNSGPFYIRASDGTYFGKIMVSWPEVPGATGYEVHRFTDRGMTENEQIFDAGNNLSYDDVSALKGTTYYYKVRAVYNKAYMSLYSPADSGYHNDNVASLPAPVMKSVSKGDYGYVKIIWSQVNLAENYKIYRNTVNKFDTSEPLPTTVNTYCEDKTAVPDTTYWYWVKANNDTADATSIPSASMSGFAKSASTAIADGETVSESAAKGSFKFYSIQVPADTTRLVVSLSGTSLTNNCDLYVKLGSYPTLSSYNAKGTATTGGETLTVSNPTQGIWYILLYGSTAYTKVTLSAQCYSVSDIVLTQVPANNLTPPFAAIFKGKVVDKDGKGIPGLSLKARDPITGTTSWLTAKTDAGGLWTFSSNIDREGAHEFDFFFTTLPDTAKGTATHTVFTRKDCWESEGLFDFSSYLPGLPSTLTPEEILNMQTYLNIRQGWEDGAIDPASETLWIEGTLGKTSLDTSVLSKLDDGLYLFFYSFDGAGAGNDLTVSPALRPYPLLVHVSPDKKSTVLDNLTALGIVGDAQKSDILAGKTGIVAFSALSNPGEDASGIRAVSLIAREQLEALANLADNNSSVSFVEDRKFGYVSSKIIKVKIDGGLREFNLAADCITVERQVTAELNAMVANYWQNFWTGKPSWNGGLALYVICPKGAFYASYNMPGGDENSHFRCASVTKSFTAAAIMLLHQQGLLNIDDLITANIPGSAVPYVPNTPDYNIPSKNLITIRMLLNHRAGVFDIANSDIPADKPVPYAGQNYIDYVKGSPGGLEHTFTFDELVGVVALNELKYFDPNTDYKYSNTGYSMLGKIIERVSGLSFAEFAKANLLAPNHLLQTSFPYLGANRSIPAPFETGYSYHSSTITDVTLDNMSPHVAEGNVITTPSDLGNWMRRLIEGQAGLSAATVNQMITGTGSGTYGLGIISVPGLGYGHNGAHNGYMSAAFCDPKQDVTVIVYTSVISWDDLAGQMNTMYNAGRAAKNILGYSTTEPY